MFRAIYLLSSVVLTLSVSADVTFNIGAIGLKDQNGEPLVPGSGLIVFAASTANGSGFDEPSETLFFPGADDVVLNFLSYTETDPGEFGHQVVEEFGPLGLSSGDLVRLYWFPTLSVGSLGTVVDGKPTGQPGAGTPYGVFPPVGQSAGSWPANWTTPGDGGTISPIFEAPTDGTGVANNFTPVPEPSFYAGVFAAGCLAWAMVSKSRRQRKMA